jgi:hypothetical protein
MRWIAVVTTFATICSSGCSFVVGSRQPLTIMASDPNAQIYVDGKYEGQGTVTVLVRRDQGHAVMARLGDRTGTASTRTGISGVGILDIVGCGIFLVPCFGLAAPGFRTLRPANVTVKLPPA